VKALVYNKFSGSTSTSTAVSGISLASQYAIAPPSNFVSTERFGDFSKNWNRCSFFRRASGAVAGPGCARPYRHAAKNTPRAAATTVWLSPGSYPARSRSRAP